MSEVGDIFKPGDKVPNSGIYDATHDRNHTARHQVTCVYGEPFPPCRNPFVCVCLSCCRVDHHNRCSGHSSQVVWMKVDFLMHRLQIENQFGRRWLRAKVSSIGAPMALSTQTRRNGEQHRDTHQKPTHLSSPLSIILERNIPSCGGFFQGHQRVSVVR